MSSSKRFDYTKEKDETHTEAVYTYRLCRGCRSSFPSPCTCDNIEPSVSWLSKEDYKIYEENQERAAKELREEIEKNKKEVEERLKRAKQRKLEYYKKFDCIIDFQSNSAHQRFHKNDIEFTRIIQGDRTDKEMREEGYTKKKIPCIKEGCDIPYEKDYYWQETLSSLKHHEHSTILHVPFEHKDVAKILGAKWSNKYKCWYIPPYKNPTNVRHLLNIFHTSNYIAYLTVSREEKDIAKSLGARWGEIICGDEKGKRWYIPAGSHPDVYNQLTERFNIEDHSLYSNYEDFDMTK